MHLPVRTVLLCFLTQWAGYTHVHNGMQCTSLPTSELPTRLHDSFKLEITKLLLDKIVTYSCKSHIVVYAGCPRPTDDGGCRSSNIPHRTYLLQTTIAALKAEVRIHTNVPVCGSNSMILQQHMPPRVTDHTRSPSPCFRCAGADTCLGLAWLPM